MQMDDRVRLLLLLSASLIAWQSLNLLHSRHPPPVGQRMYAMGGDAQRALYLIPRLTGRRVLLLLSSSSLSPGSWAVVMSAPGASPWPRLAGWQTSRLAETGAERRQRTAAALHRIRVDRGDAGPAGPAGGLSRVEGFGVGAAHKCG